MCSIDVLIEDVLVIVRSPDEVAEDLVDVAVVRLEEGGLAADSRERARRQKARSEVISNTKRNEEDANY